MSDEVDHEGTVEIVCPYCGYEVGDSWEYRDDDTIEECSGCGKEYEYSRDVTVEYYSRKMCRCREDCRGNQFTYFCLCRICSSGNGTYQSLQGKHCDEGFNVATCENKGKNNADFVPFTELLKKD